jgi:hypothetical protein
MTGRSGQAEWQVRLTPSRSSNILKGGGSAQLGRMRSSPVVYVNQNVVQNYTNNISHRDFYFYYFLGIWAAHHGRPGLAKFRLK